MKKYIAVILALVLGIAFVGCTGSIDESKDKEPIDQGGLSQANDDYETIGEIIEFTKEGVHVLTGDIAEVFKVEPEKTREFYLGETVGVVKTDNNKFELEKYKVADFSVRHTNMGEMISKASGKIKEADKSKFTITTKDGDLEFEAYDEILLDKGTEIIVEYLEREEGNILIDFYNESVKLNLSIKSIRRVENTGEMVLDTEDANGIKYTVYILGRTVLNFNHSDLKAGDEISVYPDIIRESYPAQVDAKMINR